MTTLRELLICNDGVNKLDKQVWLGKITGFNRAQLLSRDDYCLNPQQLQEYRAGLVRLQSGEPLAYIAGVKEFYSREFMVTPATLIPRPETELLVDEVISRAPLNGRVLDLGTGSGCIAITVKLERPDLSLIGVDVSVDALDIARQNMLLLAAKVSFYQSDWYSGLDSGDRFDIIVSNPPYIENNDEHLVNLSYEPLTALTDFADGLNCIRKITADAVKYLTNGGWLLIEHGYNQGMKVREIFASAGLCNVASHTDYAGIERITLGQKL